MLQQHVQATDRRWIVVTESRGVQIGRREFRKGQVAIVAAFLSERANGCLEIVHDIDSTTPEWFRAQAEMAA